MVGEPETVLENTLIVSNTSVEIKSVFFLFVTLLQEKNKKAMIIYLNMIV